MKDFNKGIFFLGKSGSGKDTFYASTLEKYQIEPITPYTTRPKRPEEKEGKQYYFISQEKMNLLEQKMSCLKCESIMSMGEGYGLMLQEKSILN